MYTTQWKAHYVHRCLRDEVMRKIKQMQGSFTLDSDNTLIISEAANVKGYWFRVRLGTTVSPGILDDIRDEIIDEAAQSTGVTYDLTLKAYGNIVEVDLIDRTRLNASYTPLLPCNQS